MRPNAYQQAALTTALSAALDPVYATLGLVGESGEVAELVKKSIRDGEKPDHADRMRRELGDVLWYIAVLAHLHGLTLEDVMRANLAKLAARAATGTLGGSGDYRGEAATLPPTERGSAGFGSTGTGPVEGPDDRYRKGYRAGYDDGYEDGCEYRTILEARVRRLEAEVLEARAEAAQWARELDGERAAVVAHLRAAAHAPHPIEADTPMLSPGGSGLLLLEAARIERGEHRAGGSDV